MSFLTAAVLEEVHTAREYLPWVKNLIRQVQDEQDGLERLRFGRGFAKELMNEAFPLGKFVSQYFDNSPDVFVGLKVGNQTYDATIQDNRTVSSSICYAEVTLAHEGEEKYLRTKCLHEEGMVHGFGKIIKEGTKKSGLNFYAEPEAISTPELLTLERNLLEKALDKKIGKPYPENTVLVIGFEDIMAHDRPINIKNLEATLDAYQDRLCLFHTVAVVGVVCDLFICRQTGSMV